MSLLDRSAVLLLDMNGTFMFGEGRSGPEQDFYATYRSLDGYTLDAATVTRAIRDCYRSMNRDYESLDRFDDFPSDLPHLEAVFAVYESGSISPSYVGLL